MLCAGGIPIAPGSSCSSARRNAEPLPAKPFSSISPAASTPTRKRRRSRCSDLTRPAPSVIRLVNQLIYDAMARPSNTEQRRAQITGGLLKVMAKRGYDGASIGDIAKAARLTPGLVHYHFDNKQEILLAALHELVARHTSNLERRLAEADGDPAAEVAAFIDVHLGLGADADPEALACWILISGEALRDSMIRAEFARALTSIAERLAAILRRGVEQRTFKCEAPAEAAGALVATIQGYFVLAATARDVIPRGSAARSACRMAEALLHPTRPLSLNVSRTSSKGPRR